MTTTKLNQNNNRPLILDHNGKYFIAFKGICKSNFAASFWNQEGDPPAGKITASFEGNTGDPPAELDLSVHDNTFSFDVKVPNITLEVEDLPPQSKIYFYCN
jgi:hypothetical protein